MSTNLRTFIYFLIVCLTVFAPNSAVGKSLYVVNHFTNTPSNKLWSFDILDDELVFQEEVAIPVHGYGAVDMTIDDDNKILFISFERNPDNMEPGGNIIELIHSTSLRLLKELTVGSSCLDLSGLAYDSARSRLYATNRNTNELYVFNWDPDNLILESIPGNPIELENIDYACGLTLNGDILYVSDFYYILGDDGVFSDYVYAYDVTDNFSHIDTIDMGEAAVAIAYSSPDNALYAGAFRGVDSIPTNYAIRRNFDPNSAIVQQIGANVVAVTAHADYPDTLFLTNYRNGSSIEMWDTSDWPLDPCDPNEFTGPVFAYDSSNDDGITISNPYFSPI